MDSVFDVFFRFLNERFKEIWMDLLGSSGIEWGWDGRIGLEINECESMG